MKGKTFSVAAKMRDKSADSTKLTKIYTSCINIWAQNCAYALLVWANRTCCKGAATVNVAAAAPMGSSSAKSSREGVRRGWGESSHEATKRCLLLLSSEAQQEFKNLSPSSHKVQVLSNSPFCSLVAWLRLVCQENAICPSVTLHFCCVLCWFGYTVLLGVCGTKPATCNPILFNAAQDSIRSALWSKWAFTSHAIWGTVGADISSLPFGEYNCLRPFHTSLHIWLARKDYLLLSKPNLWLKAQDFAGSTL